MSVPRSLGSVMRPAVRWVFHGRAHVCIAGVILAGCAARYEMPIAEVKAFAVKVQGSPVQILEAGAAVLEARGYEIVTRKAETGYLMTSTLDDKLAEEDCDCGRIGETKALAVPGTHTRHMLELQAEEGVVKLNVGIDAWHIAARGDSSKVYCVSLGQLEKRVASEIIRELR